MEGGPRPIPGLQAGEEFRMDLRSALYVRLSVETITGQGRSLERSDRTEEFFREMTPPDVAGFRSISHVHFSSDGRAYVYSYTRLLSELFIW